MSDTVGSSFHKLSVKAIERTVEGDHQLMLMPAITKAVSRRLTDDTISVREAAVSLVGSYVVQFPAVTKAFHASLLHCLSGVGVPSANEP
jgi:cohesin loading factor subunit SCC2